MRVWSHHGHEEDSNGHGDIADGEEVWPAPNIIITRTNNGNKCTITSVTGSDSSTNDLLLPNEHPVCWEGALRYSLFTAIFYPQFLHTTVVHGLYQHSGYLTVHARIPPTL